MKYFVFVFLDSLSILMKRSFFYVGNESSKKIIFILASPSRLSRVFSSSTISPHVEIVYWMLAKLPQMINQNFDPEKLKVSNLLIFFFFSFVYLLSHLNNNWLQFLLFFFCINKWNETFFVFQFQWTFFVQFNFSSKV